MQEAIAARPPEAGLRSIRTRFAEIYGLVAQADVAVLPGRRAGGQGHAELEPLRVDSGRRIKLECNGARITSDGGRLRRANFLRTLALPEEDEHGSLTTLREVQGSKSAWVLALTGK